MENKFIKHIPCPKCNSRDNLAQYSDGHCYCFGCGYFIPAVATLEKLKQKLEKEEKGQDGITILADSVYFSPDLPLLVKTWLKKYGISDKEIQHYGLSWNQKTQSLVFPIRNPETKSLMFRQERYFGNAVGIPKYKTYGEPSEQVGYIRSPLHPGVIILVEDFISAMKVARLCSSAPLLGSSISTEALLWLATRFKRVRIWLDMDKATKALQEASRCLAVVLDAGTIITQYDPKEYTTNEIQLLLKRSLERPIHHEKLK